MQIYEKLLNIQRKLKAPKGQYNSFGKYKYRSCEDILEAVKPVLAEEKCALTIRDEILAVSDRIYIKAISTLTDVETGESVENFALAREENEKKGMDGSQITGTASSYARKYCLNGLFCIDDTKDADTVQTGKGEPKKVKPIKCAKCNAELTEIVKRDGSLWPVAEQVKYCKKRFGVSLCGNCMKEETKKPDKYENNGEVIIQ